MFFSPNRTTISFDLARPVVLDIIKWNAKLIRLLEVCCFRIVLNLLLNQIFHFYIMLLTVRKYRWFNHIFFIIRALATIYHDVFEAAFLFLFTIAKYRRLSSWLLRNSFDFLAWLISNIFLGCYYIRWIWRC
jgi:hypothetical protein